MYSDLRTDPNQELRPGNRFVTKWNTDPRSDFVADLDFSRNLYLDLVSNQAATGVLFETMVIQRYLGNVSF